MTEKTFLTATIYVGRGSAIHDTCAKRLPRKARPYWNHKHGHACIVALCTNQLANELAHSFPFLCKNVFGHKCLFLKSISINFFSLFTSKFNFTQDFGLERENKFIVKMETFYKQEISFVKHHVCSAINQR